MRSTHLVFASRSATKRMVIALLLLLLNDLGRTAALDDLVARETADRDNESVQVYGGSVGQLEAVFLLEWDEYSKMVNGQYYYPARGRDRMYRLAGSNPTPGVLLLREFTTTESGGEKLSADCRLTKRVTEGRVIWEGEMRNTDGRSLQMKFSRGRENSEQASAAPASEGAIINDGSEVTLEGLFVTAQGADENERLVPYEAIKLRKPITIRTEDGLRENISHLKLWLENSPPDTFSKNAGKFVQATGKVSYLWHGPSSFINPAKFHVSKIEAAAEQESGRPDSSAADSSKRTDENDAAATDPPADTALDLVAMGTLERLNEAESVTNHVNSALARMNEGSLVLDIESGKAVTLVLPPELTTGELVLVPELSEGLVHEPNALYDMGNLVVATFKDTANPSKYFVYHILRDSPRPGVPLHLTEVGVYTISDPDELARRVEESVRNTNSPWRDNWERSKSARSSRLVNTFNLLDGNGNPAHRPQDEGSVDLLTPIYRSYDKYREWETLALQNQPPDFDKLLPNGSGIFRWTSDHGIQGRQGQQIAALCPVPPNGYQKGRKVYAGWTTDMVDDFMRALYFYSSARSQVMSYQRADAEKKKAATDSIEEIFR